MSVKMKLTTKRVSLDKANISQVFGDIGVQFLVTYMWEQGSYKVRIKSYLFRLGRLLSFVQNGFETLVESGADARVFGRRIILKDAEQFDRQPGSRNEVICVILEICRK